MPKDQVKNITFETLFSSTAQYEIPFFQRGYAWKKDNWEQLFNDIREQILDEIDETSNFSDQEHFFGPIVVLEKNNADPELRRLLVIDGQQRITTVYLLLGVITAHLKTKSHLSGDATKHISELERFLVNKVTGEEDYRKLKVYSSKGDRLPTYRAVFAEENPRSANLNADLQLYNQKTNQVDAFIRYANKRLTQEYTDVPKLWQLAQALLKSLKLVWIPLEDGADDAQAIFESLNDKGMRLSASELICSFVFRQIKKNQDQIHSDYWLRAIKEVGGADQFEEFLRCLVSIDQKKMVGENRNLYVFFKKTNKLFNEDSAQRLLSTIRDLSPSYNQIISPEEHRHPDKIVNESLIRIQETRMDSCAPFLLTLLQSEKTNRLKLEDLRNLLKETMVLLIRRKMCEMHVTKYQIFFPSLLTRIINEPDKVLAFQEACRRDGLWVSDQEFSTALVDRPLYRSRDLPFTRMILREIDKSLQTFGQFPDYSTLGTVEHILPQTLDKEWIAYLKADAKHDNLDRYTNTLGNLCLLSGPANSSAGQDPFEAKKISYTDVSALTRDVKGRNVHWDIDAIQKRSADLAVQALKLWSWTQVESSIIRKAA